MSAWAICELCGGPISADSLRANYYCTAVTAWELPRREHEGGSSLVGRRRTPDRVAHVACARANAPATAGLPGIAQ